MYVPGFRNQPRSTKEAGELGLKRGNWLVASRLELAPVTVLLLCWGWRSFILQLAQDWWGFFCSFCFSNPLYLRHVSGTFVFSHFCPSTLQSWAKQSLRARAWLWYLHFYYCCCCARDNFVAASDAYRMIRATPLSPQCSIQHSRAKHLSPIPMRLIMYPAVTANDVRAQASAHVQIKMPMLLVGTNGSYTGQISYMLVAACGTSQVATLPCMTVGAIGPYGKICGH